MLMFYLNKHVNNVEEHENILEMVQCSPTTSTQRLSTCLGVSQTCIWRTLHDDSLYPFHQQCVQILHPGDSAMHVEFCHWLHINHQLLLLILFTDEAFTRNRINDTRNSHQWAHSNPHGTVQTDFQRCFSINVWCGMINAMLIGTIILDCMTEYNYLDFLQNGLPEQQRMFLWLHGLLCTFSVTEPLLIILNLWCNISMPLSLIGDHSWQYH
jgi:hypothetical protein